MACCSFVFQQVTNHQDGRRLYAQRFAGMAVNPFCRLPAAHSERPCTTSQASEAQGSSFKSGSNTSRRVPFGLSFLLYPWLSRSIFGAYPVCHGLPEATRQTTRQRIAAFLCRACTSCARLLPSAIDWGQNPPQSIFSFICSHGKRNVKELGEIFTTSNSQKRQVPQCIKNIAGLGKKTHGGGGGNRTPVREHSTRSIYRLRSGLYLAVSVAPDQARYDKPAGNISRKTPASAGFRQPDACRRPGLSGVVPISATGYAVSA